MTENEMKAEMEKPIMVAMHGLNWFLVLSLFEQVLNMDDVFSNEQDRDACRQIFSSIHNQVFNKEDKSLMDMLTIKPKKLITKPDLIL
jgi:hypothetical protein